MTLQKYSFAGMLGLIGALLGAAAPVEDQIVTADWADPNFALCEDIGVHASGRVSAVARLSIGRDGRILTSLIIGTTPTAAHRSSGSIEWTAPDDRRMSRPLQSPWFPVLSPVGAGPSLVLPRSGASNGPAAQLPLKLKPGTPVKLMVNLVFVTPSGSCPTSFVQTWVLPG